MVVFVKAVLIVLSVLFFFVISVELLGGGITLIDHPLLCFQSLHYNIAVLAAAMLLLSFLSDRRFLSPLLYSLTFFSKFLLPSWLLQSCPSCIPLTPLLLPACHSVNRFIASSLFLYLVIFPNSYRILLLC